jgi:hypothetical protein
MSANSAHDPDPVFALEAEATPEPGPGRGPGLGLLRDLASNDLAPCVSRRDLSALEGDPSLLNEALKNSSLDGDGDAGPQE